MHYQCVILDTFIKSTSEFRSDTEYTKESGKTCSIQALPSCLSDVTGSESLHSDDGQRRGHILFPLIVYF